MSGRIYCSVGFLILKSQTQADFCFTFPINQSHSDLQEMLQQPKELDYNTLNKKHALLCREETESSK